MAIGLPALSQAASPGETVAIKLLVNGVPHKLTIDARVTLLDLVREHLNLTGTKMSFAVRVARRR